MIAFFARSNHPEGWGFPARERTDVARAHGYVVVGVRCRTEKQLTDVLTHMREHGLDLPDLRNPGARVYVEEMPENRYERTVFSPATCRWFSGGPGDWDHLFTVPGNKMNWPPHTMPGTEHVWGDNRFVGLYEAAEVLA